jgi:hypothetical protein
VPAQATNVAVRGEAAVYALGGGRYGCYASGRPVTLEAPPAGPKGPPSVRATLARVTLNGHDVAFSRTASGVDTNTVTVEVFDLRGRRRLERQAAVTKVVGPESVSSVAAIRLRSDGAVAWIAAVTSLGSGNFAREVHGARGGHGHLLDRSRTIVVHSLGLRGRYVLWRDGRERKARL